MNAQHTTTHLASRDRTPGLRSRLRHAGLCLAAMLAIAGHAGPAGAADAERFEVVKVKAVRPALAETVAALEKGDVAGARAALEAYDSLWNGIEIYIGAHSRNAEESLEHVQDRIEKALNTPTPDTAAVLTDARALLTGYDEAIGMVVKAPPLDPLYDDVARLRIVRAHLREAARALKAGDVEKARTSFADFRHAWAGVEDLIKAHSTDDDAAIAKGMVETEALLEKQDAAGAAALVKDLTAKYNATHSALLKQARSK